VILGSEKRQPLVDDDIPLPSGLPAVALKWILRVVSLATLGGLIAHHITNSTLNVASSVGFIAARPLLAPE
jgi:hypothetical protein